MRDFDTEARQDDFPAPVDFDRAPRGISRPVLLLETDPAEGGMVTEGDAEYAMFPLADACDMQIEGADHNLSMFKWEVTPLLTTVIEFFHSL